MMLNRKNIDGENFVEPNSYQVVYLAGGST